ncbi:MAG TPA: DNA polymerase III subunit delta [Candidatus Binatia bacterium]|nr:DNA polymerase III subunit delta [Candidatus Binatia bacterium]
MDLAAFRAALRRKQLLPAYLFTGTQDLLKAEAVDELRRAAGGERSTVRSFFGGESDVAKKILEAKQNLSLLDPVAVIAVRQAAKLARAEAEALTQTLSSKGPPVVFWDESFDKRQKLYAEIARGGGEVEFEAPRGEALAAWVRRESERLGHRLDPAAAAALLELVGDDLLRLRSTLERLSLAVDRGAAIDEASVTEHVVSIRMHAVYELQEALSAKQATKAVGLLRRLVDEGSEPPALIGALVAQVRRLLLAREAPGSASLAALLGVAPHRVRYVLDHSRRFSAARLRRAIDDLADLDVASKTGRGDTLAALEEWLIAISSPERKPAGP